MMTRSLIVLSFIALAACAETGMGAMPGGSPEARFVTAVENNGCILNQANTAKVLAESGLTADEVTEVVTKLTAEGRVTQTMGASLQITSDRCS